MTGKVVGADYTDGALLPNYVNGRLLVAEDLATSQASLRTRDTRIGEAAGAGVVRGLWVTGTSTTLTITPGLGISEAGEPVVVPRKITLQLTFAVAAETPNHADFSCCGGEPVDGSGSSLTAGVLLLVARPACRLEGQAPMMAAPGSLVSPCCAAQWQVEGVEFRAIALPVGTTVAGEDVTSGNRRNLVAHWCFGTEQLATLGQDPFGFDPAYSGLDDLDPADLTPYDVPLAVFSWDGQGVADLDNWSARRRVTDPDPVLSSWSVTVADRRETDGMARFLQFQDQAEELVSRAMAGSAKAPDHFGLLPPLGFLPVDNLGFRKMAEDAVRDAVVNLAEKEPVATAADVEDGSARDWASRNYLLEGEAMESATPQALKKQQIGYYKNLAQIAEASVGYGYDPAKFFGPLGRLGGVIDWELAEWALNQSWKAMPVATGVDYQPDPDTDDSVGFVGEISPEENVRLEEGADIHGMALGPNAMADRSGRGIRGSRAPITYYYVIQNLEAAESSTTRYRRGSKSTRKKIGFVKSNLYVVFIANRRWARGSRPPFMDYALQGLLHDR